MNAYQNLQNFIDFKIKCFEKTTITSLSKRNKDYDFKRFKLKKILNISNDIKIKIENCNQEEVLYKNCIENLKKEYDEFFIHLIFDYDEEEDGTKKDISKISLSELNNYPYELNILNFIKIKAIKINLLYIIKVSENNLN